jgi:hypothetical protein
LCDVTKLIPVDVQSTSYFEITCYEVDKVNKVLALTTIWEGGVTLNPDAPDQCVCVRGVWLGLYRINIFVVWVECVKDLLVNVCNGTAKSAEIGSRDMPVSTGQHADCAGGLVLVLLFGENPQAVA